MDPKPCSIGEAQPSNQPEPGHRPRLKFRPLLGACFALPSLALAQAVPAAPKTDETVFLDPFQVTTSTNEGYLPSQSTASGRIAQRLENIPQNIGVVNARFLEEIGAINVVDSLRFVAGVSANNDERNQSNGVSIRGFGLTSLRRNGENAGAATSPMAEAVEQYEVVKGPAGVLYGASAPGGLVNVVTKSPRFTPGLSLTARGFGMSGFGGYSTSVDATGPLPFLRKKDGAPTAAYRLVLVHERRKEFRMNDDHWNRDGFFAKTNWAPVKGLRISAEWERLQSEFNVPTALQTRQEEIVGAPVDPRNPSGPKKTARDVRLPDTYLPVGWTSFSANAVRKNYDDYIQGSVSYTRDTARWGSWTGRVFVSYLAHYDVRFRSNGNPPLPVVQADLGKVVNFDQRVTQADIDRGRLWVPTRTFDRTQFMNNSVLSSQWDLTGQFKTGPLSHTLLLGTEQPWGQTNKRGPSGGTIRTQEVRIAYAGAAGTALAIWADSPDLRPIPANFDDLRDSVKNPNGTITTSVVGNAMQYDGFEPKIPFLQYRPATYYFGDDVAALNDRLHFTYGARHDELTAVVGGLGTQTFSRWTYRYGALLKLANWAHLYASHSESFLPNDQGPASALGRIVPPQDGVQDEIGLRSYFLDRRITTLVSAFTIENKNIIVTNIFAGATAPANERYTFVDGTRVEGLEFSATLNLSAETQAIANFARLDGSSTPTPAQRQATPNLAFVPLLNVPRDSYSLFARWAPRRIAGLHVRTGYRWVSERGGGAAGSLPSYYMPAYGILDAGAGYARGKWNFDLNVRNALDAYAFRSGVTARLLYAEKPVHATFTVRTRL